MFVIPSRFSARDLGFALSRTKIPRSLSVAPERASLVLYSG
jgi:hypothetical protein